MCWANLKTPSQEFLRVQTAFFSAQPPSCEQSAPWSALCFALTPCSPTEPKLPPGWWLHSWLQDIPQKPRAHYIYFFIFPRFHEARSSQRISAQSPPHILCPQCWGPVERERQDLSPTPNSHPANATAHTRPSNMHPVVAVQPYISLLDLQMLSAHLPVPLNWGVKVKKQNSEATTKYYVKVSTAELLGNTAKSLLKYWLLQLENQPSFFVK